MVHGRSTEIITMIKWIRTSRLSKKNSLSLDWTCTLESEGQVEDCEAHFEVVVGARIQHLRRRDFRYQPYRHL